MYWPSLSVCALNHCALLLIYLQYFQVPQFCQKYGEALGKYSEQSLESCHADFVKTWQHYKRKEEHPDFGEKLLSAVVNYNSWNA